MTETPMVGALELLFSLIGEYREVGRHIMSRKNRYVTVEDQRTLRDLEERIQKISEAMEQFGGVK